jgi:hypothetical protein
MEHTCGHFLVQYLDKDIRPTHQNENKCLVIIETRTSFWLPLVIKNAIDKCPEYNLHVFGTPNVIQFLDIHVKGDYKKTRIDCYMRNIQDYNMLLTNTSFWERIEEEHIIIFQLDTLFLRPPTDNHYKYDYIGAVCGDLQNENTFIINGGLSYRSKQAMIKACDMIEPDDLNKTEDIVFTTLMRKHPDIFSLPTIKTCNNFAIETIGNVDNAIGIHGTDKYYIFDKNIYTFLKTFS